MTFTTNLADALTAYVSNSTFSSLFILTDENVYKNCFTATSLQKLVDTKNVFILPQGENTKNIDTCIFIWNELNRLGADRKSLIINLGGGMITDLGGFIASTYKRGIRFINIPTSMLAMIDASVGGKNGINLGHYKNQIGTITQPGEVFVYPLFLETLDRRNYLSGFAEALKHGFLEGRELLETAYTFAQMEINKPFIAFLKRNIEVKERIVAKDPLEKGDRKALNLGHTVGHAIEALSHEKNTPLLHGEAVAWGLAAELYISHLTYNFDEATAKNFETFVQNYFVKPDLAYTDIDKLMDYMQQDKKNEHGKINFTLLNDIGNFKTDCVVEKEIIIESIKKIIALCQQ
ncbi:MAG: 3-dehydroquinate synthase [Salinivirgaceae bacterium]|jgi:3-dehydroquinate synthase|nr:3-dehydroquinate synthase [Salinivirgaceae bacterium]